MLYVWWDWRRTAKISLSSAAVFEVISISITAVSILLPTIGALLIYYLSRITPAEVSTAYPLIVAIGWFGLSLISGLWNAWTFITEKCIDGVMSFTKHPIAVIVWLSVQIVAFVVAVVVLTVFFLVTPLDISGLLKQS